MGVTPPCTEEFDHIAKYDSWAKFMDRRVIWIGEE